MADRKIRRALIAVYDKTGIAEFARALVDEFGIEIISTGGTAKHLKEAGIPVTMVEEVTGFPEMLDGRVKTLHPKIHAGILADRDNPEHMRQLAEHGIEPIDMVVVNLYPFEKTVADPNCRFEDAIEMIDIGGPCLLRAAAKNHRHVLVISSTDSCSIVLDWLRNAPNRLDQKDRKDFAKSAFWVTTRYDAAVSQWMDTYSKNGESTIQAIHLHNWGKLRYGENPHQISELTRWWNPTTGLDLTNSDAGVEGQENWQKRISFNNYFDADAALGLCAELTRAGQNVWDRLIAGSPQETESGDRLLAGPTRDAGLTCDRPLAGSTQSEPLSPISREKFTRRNLPHLQRPGATYFVTFRTRQGELSPDERDIAMECCLFPDAEKACIHAITIMPDHVHMVMTPLDAEPDRAFQLGEILHGIKGVSGRRIADLRGRGSGPVWQDESFDRIMRGKQEFTESLEYVRRYPVTAGLCREGEYPWCVIEVEAGWNSYTDSAGVDLKHKLSCDCRDELLRPWNRLLAGSTLSGSTLEEEHRLLACATSVGARPAESAPAASKLGGSAPVGAAKSLPVAVFIKHTNACGAGIDPSPEDAYRRAYLGDPNAAMGGILAVNFDVSAEFATMVMETYDRFGKAAGAGGFFVEVWVAPSFDKNAIEIIRTKKKWGENVRLLAVGDMSAAPNADELEYKTIAGGMLVQGRDLVGLNEDQWNVVTKREPSEAEMADLRLAWLVAKHTKSNAISLCKDGMLIGNGAGQMSRVMSCRIATWLAKENGHADKLAGSVAASDAFFPFRDGPEILLDAGVTAIIQPGGSKRDEETIAACDARGAAMIFTGTRHFKH